MSLAENMMNKKIAEIMQTQRNCPTSLPTEETVGITIGWGIRSLRTEPVDSGWSYPAEQAEQPCP